MRLIRYNEDIFVRAHDYLHVSISRVIWFKENRVSCTHFLALHVFSKGQPTPEAFWVWNLETCSTDYIFMNDWRFQKRPDDIALHQPWDKNAHHLYGEPCRHPYTWREEKNTTAHSGNMIQQLAEFLNQGHKHIRKLGENNNHILVCILALVCTNAYNQLTVCSSLQLLLTCCASHRITDVSTVAT